ncbi:arylsulfatase [Rubritalea tangerina]|uniref:Arylsulfatase n=1 Tax=Rubritalea tangerina TaxID=430798 RepID=A0ABW4ZF10_9BACT
MKHIYHIIFGAALAAQSSLAAEQANVVFIMADDLGYRHLSCYGQKRIETPHIDAIARKGMMCTEAYAGATVCGPSRASLMTGLHSGHIPYQINSAVVDLSSDYETLGELFQRAGYETGAFGKWGIGGMGSGQTPNDRGFDYFFGMLDQSHGHTHYPSYLIENNKVVKTKNVTKPNGRTSERPEDRVEHSHTAFTEHALEFIEQNAKRPFFCYLSFTLPHTEIIATDEAVAPFVAKGWPEYVAGTSIHIRQQAPRAHFAGMLKMVDDSVGQVTKKLESLGLDENTVVIFTSDNGGQLKKTWGKAPSEWFSVNGELRGGKEASYEGGLRVPFVVQWPSQIKAGSVSDFPFYFADMMPTFAELTEQSVKNPVDGISVLPTWTGGGEKQGPRNVMFWSHKRGVIDHAVRKGDWKAVKRGNNAVEVYNLKEDVSETKNLAKQKPEMAEAFEEIIREQYTPERPRGQRPSKDSASYPKNLKL